MLHDVGYFVKYIITNRFVDCGVYLAVFDHFAKARANLGNGLAQWTKKASLIPLAIFFEPLFVAWTAQVF